MKVVPRAKPPCLRLRREKDLAPVPSVFEARARFARPLPRKPLPTQLRACPLPRGDALLSPEALPRGDLLSTTALRAPVVAGNIATETTPPFIPCGCGLRATLFSPVERCAYCLRCWNDASDHVPLRLRLLPEKEETEVVLSIGTTFPSEAKPTGRIFTGRPNLSFTAGPRRQPNRDSLNSY